MADAKTPREEVIELIERDRGLLGRPMTEDGLPIIGKVPQLDGAYVATGHNVWGVLNAPATGEALAEMIDDSVARTIDLTPLDPIRLRRLDPSLLRSS